MTSKTVIPAPTDLWFSDELSCSRALFIVIEYGNDQETNSFPYDAEGNSLSGLAICNEPHDPFTWFVDKPC